MPAVLIAAIAVFGLAGCATPFRAPPDVAHITLDRVDSPVVRVQKIWLERKDGALVVTGYVVRRLDAAETAQTHLDVTLYDATGRVLRSTVGHFEARKMAQPRKHPATAYRVVLDPLATVTYRIEVRAHEGDH